MGGFRAHGGRGRGSRWCRGAGASGYGAIRLLADWPAPARAARLFCSKGLDEDRFETLTPAAEALAATLMRRAMIDYTLRGAKSKRYRHAARHLAACAACDTAIADYGDPPTHDAFLASLREDHRRKPGFWGLADG
ncbi:DUF6880 family protein [Roseovarius tibetensis]|uniref:DUF6880 family protein n=1 Tax=Roseovarius tibetensis TaxID=2685897 RepID=UPI003D7F9CB1